MRINEIFYSLQGEGGNTGRAAIFIRLSLCNLNCYFCDTDFEWGEELSLEEIYDRIKDYKSKFIVWTGGEPTLQLKNEHIEFFKLRGYTSAIETNGTRKVPSLIDYITCSPKIDDWYRLNRNLPNGVDELRFPIAADGNLPPDISLLPKAKKYFVSPIFIGDDAMKIDPMAVQRCVDFIMQNPEWTLSLQTHKLIDIK